MSEPRSIEPQDIRVGMRVRNEQNLGRDDTATWEFTVESIADADRNFVSTSGRRFYFGLSSGTWTLLADAPKPDRPVGSHWRGTVLECAVEYVLNQNGDYLPVRMPEGWSVAALRRGYEDDAIARLTPIPAFDPAALWPAISHGENVCDERDENGDRLVCCRVQGHSGLHAAYIFETQPVRVWGDPR